MLIDFKVDKDEYGYFVLGYRMMGKVEIQFNTNKTLAMTFNLLPDEYKEYIIDTYGSEEKLKNDRLHFSTYQSAVKCAEGLRDLVPKAMATGNLHLAE